MRQEFLVSEPPPIQLQNIQTLIQKDRTNAMELYN